MATKYSFLIGVSEGPSSLIVYSLISSFLSSKRNSLCASTPGFDFSNLSVQTTTKTSFLSVNI